MPEPSAPPTGPSPAPWAPVVEAIGPKVRDLRQQAGLSLQQLARRADVSSAAIHKVERGDMVPTITTLLKLAAALGRPIGHFVDGGPRAPVTSVVRGAQRPALSSDDPAVTRAAITAVPARFRTAGTLTELSAGAVGASAGGHSGEELVHVLDGTLEVDVDGEAHTLAAGDTLQYPSDRPAHWRNPGPAPARALRVTTRDA